MTYPQGPRIKFLDLSRLHAPLRQELTEAFHRALDQSTFIQGAPVQAFEREFATFTGSAHCIGVANGTDALEIALEALEIGPGHAVLTPSMTFAATAEAIVRQGATPVFAEIDPGTGCVTAETLREALARAKHPVKAVIAVHLFGRLCDLQGIAAFCRENQLRLIEDCAQAHAARDGDRHAGTIGEIGTFSFFPGKNLGALGDAGAVITASEDLARKVRLIRDHGRTDKYVHRQVGRNSRLDALQASFLSIKLPHLEEWTRRRREFAKLYAESLAGIEGFEPLPVPSDPATHAFHLLVCRVTSKRRDRAALMSHLTAQGIESGIHYPHPLHLQEAFRAWAPSGGLPATERLSSEIVSLPLDPLMSAEDVIRVTDTARRFFQS